MKIEHLAKLSCVLMHAHHDVTSALGRAVGGSVDAHGVRAQVFSAIRDAEMTISEFRNAHSGAEYAHNVTIEVNTEKMPAIAWFEKDVGGPRLVSVVAKGVDVLPLMSDADLDEFVDDVLAMCAKAACDEA